MEFKDYRYGRCYTRTDVYKRQLLITDDGALAHELLSPKKHVDKTYYAVTDGCMTKEDVQRFADGLEIGEKNPTMPAKLKILSTRKVEETELEQYPSCLLYTSVIKI